MRPQLLSPGAPPLRIRRVLEAVSCGFPSPAQDYDDGDLDPVEHLVRDPDATVIEEAVGDAMEPYISNRDVLVIDRGVRPPLGSLAAATVDGEPLVRRIRHVRGSLVLAADNPKFPDILIPELTEMTITGAVTWVLRREHADMWSPTLGEMLVRDPVSTYVMRAEGTSMEPVIQSGDELIIDRGVRPRIGKAVVATVNGELTAKRLWKVDGRPALVPDNPLHQLVPIDELTDLSIWGPITWVLHRER